MPPAPGLFGYRKHWPHRFLPVPVLPMSRAEMDELRWDSCDVILVTGDAYVDHPAFGVALIGRLLEAQGFRVGVIAQPDWRSPDGFRALGAPNLFFGVTSGNMDSMVNRYTADGRLRSDDAYSPDDEPGRRPDRAVIAYTGRCQQAFPGVPVVLGGIEASLRRAAHYDCWSDKVRRSILLDAKADLLLYGNAERAVVELSHRLAAGEDLSGITGLRGSALVRRGGGGGETGVRYLPAFDDVRSDKVAFAKAARALLEQVHLPGGRTLVQRHGDREVWIRPPPEPLASAELDRIHELPYSRMPHPAYAGRRLKAWETTRFSVTILRGCYGGCTFCALGSHEGSVIQSRSEASVLREIGTIAAADSGFTGVISDLGGPTANMYRTGCGRKDRERCRRLSCLWPRTCRHLEAGPGKLIRLYRKARQLPGVKKVLIGSGIRTDLANRSPEYIRELAHHHVGGYLKVAPEHIRPGPLALMHKPGLDVHERFRELFERYSAEAGKEQYLVPYFIAAHPGTTDEDMLELALWLKRNDLRVDQVQTFLPSPMTLATAMYHTGLNPLRPSSRERIEVPRGLRTRRLHKAFLRYHDANNWPLLRRALERLGRQDLIGNARRHLVPRWQPAGTGERAEGRRRKGR